MNSDFGACTKVRRGSAGLWATMRSYRQSRQYRRAPDSLQRRKPMFWQAHGTLSLPTLTPQSGVLTINNWIDVCPLYSIEHRLPRGNLIEQYFASSKTDNALQRPALLKLHRHQIRLTSRQGLERVASATRC
jgi:hypothetical protein